MNNKYNPTFRNKDIITTVEKNSEQTSSFHVTIVFVVLCELETVIFLAVELHSVNISAFAH